MIKKLLLISLVGIIGFSMTPSLISAATPTTVAEFQMQVNALMAQVTQLQQQLTQIQSKTVSWCHDFNVNLKLGDIGEDVSSLHIALNKEGFSAGNWEQSTKNFSEGTASNVSGFQQKYVSEILAPLGLKYGTGYVGKATRAKLNELYGCGIIPKTDVSEQVKCVFKGSTENQKCYTATNSTSPYYNLGCSGIETCVTDIKGKKGDKITWKSTCGGYAYTTMDGQNEYAEFNCGITPANQSPKIISTPAIPTNIQPNQSVNFSWSATDADNDNLSWAVSWGDGTGGASTCQTPNPKNGQNWEHSTSHTWSKAGIYTVKATVNDCNEGSDIDSFIVNVGNVVVPTITVLSPNGGETWVKGSTKTIKWQDNTPSVCLTGTTCNVTSTIVKAYDIRLVTYYPPCNSIVCPAYVIAPYTIAKSVYDYSYDWSAGKVLDEIAIAPDGSYTIQVCQVNSTICDSSNSYFKIVSLSSTTSTNNNTTTNLVYIGPPVSASSENE